MTLFRGLSSVEVYLPFSLAVNRRSYISFLRGRICLITAPMRIALDLIRTRLLLSSSSSLETSDSVEYKESNSTTPLRVSKNIAVCCNFNCLVASVFYSRCILVVTLPHRVIRWLFYPSLSSNDDSVQHSASVSCLFRPSIRSSGSGAVHTRCHWLQCLRSEVGDERLPTRSCP